MSVASIPLEAKVRGPLRVLTIGRISAPHQPLSNIDAIERRC
jgi:hypothetical protein